MAGQYHEPPEELPSGLRDLTRILVSLKEEIEAIDWYNQRIYLAEDDQVRSILRHNQKEEMEHAAMALEYLRRNMDGWDEALRAYLFTEGDLVAHEEHVTGASEETVAERPGRRGEERAAGLGIGSLHAGTLNGSTQNKEGQG